MVRTCLIYQPFTSLLTLISLYKKQLVSLQAQLLSSRDRVVRDVAQHQLQSQKSAVRQNFRPSEYAQAMLDHNRHLSRKALVKVTRAFVATEEDKALSTSLKDLLQQGMMSRQFEGNEVAMCATCVAKLPPELLKFVLNVTVESLPTNANLHKWGKRPSASCPLCQGYNISLLHVLNDCPTAMALRRYATRHDKVLRHLVTFIQHHFLPSYTMTADLPDSTCSFPQHITPTNLCPDVVWWSDQLKVVWLLELTCSFETAMDQAHHLKEAKYHDLVEEAWNAEYQGIMPCL